MIVLIDIFARIVTVLLDTVSILMLLRLIIPILTQSEEGNFYTFCAVATEPFVVPVRFLLFKFNVLQNSPIDWAFIITYLLIGFISMILPII